MEINANDLFSTRLDGELVWSEFERQRQAFLNLVHCHSDATDHVLARLPAYNAFLQYGLTLHRIGGAEACRIVALALLQGQPDLIRAEATLLRFWAGLLPSGGVLQQVPRH